MADYCIVGGGIVGLATAYQLLCKHPEASLVLLEAAETLASHQTGHNSGVIHSGIYYPPGSLKARFSKLGAGQTKEFCQRHGIPYQEPGKLLVATSALELARLGQLEERAAIHGLEHERIDQAELRRREPNVSGLGALFIPSTGIVDYTAVARKLARLVTAAGGQVVTGAKVTSIIEHADRVDVGTSGGRYSCRQLVACAGLQSDRLAGMAGVDIDVQIIPFRGEYFELPPEKSDYVKHLIYPVPDPALPFLGVHLTPTVAGTITVGPNAVLGLAREGYPKFSVDLRDVGRYLRFPGLWHVARANAATAVREVRNSLFKGSYLKECRKYAPGLNKGDLLPHEAGIRAQAVRRDGTLIHDFLLAETPRMIHVLNAPSPAATAALPIGEHLASKALRPRA
ncbi:L-2-hydroxyglutarate oxidase [Pseudarthrobacter phenanthrenivorans]|uniref:L-2-hydroxyglutarate oxidase n=1 Tax=Pseudarthrobacter phenanthrenivorans TaxID=361575 RepID=A0A3B0FM47_PSEPS|nr:L-2-hydroxyglutarate oxidase [Pseudarthrobacter phenanthrenivorans]RKO20969.1 L-2-hydroxyglutarate oxidase [Pseudarthrobacter phenanthrenivorans]